MAWLNKEQVTAIVGRALKAVGDFNGPIENYSMHGFNAYQKTLFMRSIHTEIMKEPYYNYDGTSRNDKYYDVPLNETIVSSWQAIGDCIDYIVQKQQAGIRETI
jgi:hypothetical protein